MKLFAILLIVFDLAAQTRVDLVTQAKNIDFSVVPSTRPATVGTVVLQKRFIRLNPAKPNHFLVSMAQLFNPRVFRMN
jgi:hypothetical protein